MERRFTPEDALSTPDRNSEGNGILLKKKVESKVPVSAGNAEARENEEWVVDEQGNLVETLDASGGGDGGHGGAAETALEDPGDEPEKQESRAGRLTAENARQFAETTDGFDAEKALDVGGFAEFLASYEDGKEQALSSNEMHERFHLFETKNQMVDELRDICRNEISGETGIDFSDGDFEHIDAFLEKQAIENPNDLLKMKEQIDLYRELPKQIEQTQHELDGLAESSGFNEKWRQIYSQHELAEAASKGTGFLGKLKMNSGFAWTVLTGKPTEGDAAWMAQRDLKQTAGIPMTAEAIRGRQAELVEEFNKAENEFENLQAQKLIELHDLRGRLAGIKQDIFVHEELRESMAEIAQKKLREHIQDLSENGGIEGFNAAAKKLEESRIGSVTGIEYFDDTDVEVVEAHLDEQVELYIDQQVTEKVKNMELGSESFTKLETSLRELIDAEGAGSMGKEKATAFVVDTIGATIKELQKSSKKEDKARVILASQLIRKLRSSVKK
ncbi:MAG: hypothetical protein JWO73_974 [Candidatus Taylorbacteria bacterium]|nr:hypothetical protein [Candidatus Taylorbacteria bacterium]